MQCPLAMDIGCGKVDYLQGLSSKGFATVELNNHRLHNPTKTSDIILASCSYSPFRQTFSLVSIQCMNRRIVREDFSLEHLWRLWRIATTHLVALHKVGTSKLKSEVPFKDKLLGNAFNKRFFPKYNAILHLKEVPY